MTTEVQPKTVVVKLTGRAPVRIVDDDWPIIASASEDKNDDKNNVEYQANRVWKWRLKVRENEKDGRVLVYGSYHYSSNYLSDRSYNHYRGVLLDSNCKDEDIVNAIFKVAKELKEATGGKDGELFDELAYECVEDLEPVDI